MHRSLQGAHSPASAARLLSWSATHVLEAYVEWQTQLGQQRPPSFWRRPNKRQQQVKDCINTLLQLTLARLEAVALRPGTIVPHHRLRALDLRTGQRLHAAGLLAVCGNANSKELKALGAAMLRLSTAVRSYHAAVPPKPSSFWLGLDPIAEEEPESLFVEAVPALSQQTALKDVLEPGCSVGHAEWAPVNQPIMVRVSA